jgi:hypothetical protein
MIPAGREAQRRMYLSVERASYVRPGSGRSLRLKRARECLKTHPAGCGCWRSAAGGAR